MFSQVKTAAAAAFIAISASPASAAIVDIFIAATVTSTSSRGPSIDWIPSNSPAHEFANANIGDPILVHWVMDTEGGEESAWDDNYSRFSYNGDVLVSQVTLDSDTHKFGGGEGDNVTYRDASYDFGLSYGAAGYKPDWESDVLWTFNEFTLRTRPESYVTGKRLENEFNLDGNNLGEGSLSVETEYDPETYESSIFYINYQASSVVASIRNLQIAAMPLPPGVLLIASGLLGFGLLRRRKA